jgi:hypothetical protein
MRESNLVVIVYTWKYWLLFFCYQSSGSCFINFNFTESLLKCDLWVKCEWIDSFTNLYNETARLIERSIRSNTRRLARDWPESWQVPYINNLIFLTERHCFLVFPFGQRQNRKEPRNLSPPLRISIHLCYHLAISSQATMECILI